MKAKLIVGNYYLRYLDDAGKMMVSGNVTIVQVLEGMREIATQFPIFRTVSVRVLSSVRLADCQCYSVKSYQREN